MREGLPGATPPRHHYPRRLRRPPIHRHADGRVAPPHTRGCVLGGPAACTSAMASAIATGRTAATPSRPGADRVLPPHRSLSFRCGVAAVLLQSPNDAVNRVEVRLVRSMFTKSSKGNQGLFVSAQLCQEQAAVAHRGSEPRAVFAAESCAWRRRRRSGRHGRRRRSRSLQMPRHHASRAEGREFESGSRSNPFSPGPAEVAGQAMTRSRTSAAKRSSLRANS